MAAILRPPSHRGPLIAAGAVVLTVGQLLQQIRIDDLPAGWQLLISGTTAAILLWIAVAAPLEGGRPPAYQSVLIVCGLLHLIPALAEIADILGDEIEDGLNASSSTLLLGVLSLTAGLLAARRNSGIAAFVSAVAGIGALLFLADWIGDPGVGTFRWLLLVSAAALVILSLVLRGSRPRHSELLVDAAGLAILSIGLVEVVSGLFGFFDYVALPGFWELVLLAAGFGLIAYAAADRAPGPAYIGVANLAAFAAVVSLGAGRTLEWWPFTLLAVGGLMLAAGLRPARPLPPEPEGYRKDDLPLHSRVHGDERVFTVRE